MSFSEKLVDAAGALDGIIQKEVQLGGAAHLEALDEFVTDKAVGLVEGLLGLGALFRSAFDGEINARRFQIGSHADFGDEHVRSETRIAQLTFEHGHDFVLNFLGDAFVTMSGDSHGT